MESTVKPEDTTAGPSSVVASSSSSILASSQQFTTRRKVCKYYKAGACFNRSSCPFVHVSPEKTSVEPEVPILEAVEQKEPSSPVTPGTSGVKIDPRVWVNAPEFVPRSKQTQPTVVDTTNRTETQQDVEERRPQEGDEPSLSYAEIVTLNSNHNGSEIVGQPANVVLCPYYEVSGECLLPQCTYEHGKLCELCDKYCLNPNDAEQQRLHNAECIEQHERDMEHSFAIQRSKDKSCGICLEVIMDKPGREQRFGILPNCNHVFCLECIRTWRQAKNFENKIKRGCPTCRISSDYVCPSVVWVEEIREKEKLINDYKKACNTTHCKHFKQGAGKCPFGNKCFYKHALPTGELVDVGGPSRPRIEGRLRITHLQDFFREVLHQRGRLLDDFVSTFFSDSDESDHSEVYDYYDI